MNKSFIRQFLLSTGMVAVVLYTAHVLSGGYLWKGYSHLHQPISDLTANGAPDRDFLLLLTNTYGALALAFALSYTFLVASKTNKLMVWGGICFILMHITSISYAFFPQDLPGTAMTTAGLFHLIVTAVIVPLSIITPLLTGMGMLKTPQYRRLGIFSIIISALIVVLGGTTAIFFVNKLPFFGLMERLNIGCLQLWTFVLSCHFVIEKK